MSVPGQTDIRPYRPPEPSPPPAPSPPPGPESPPAPRLIPLASAIRRRVLERPVDSPPDPHDLFGIYHPVDEKTASEPASELAAAIIPGPFLNNASTLDGSVKAASNLPPVEESPDVGPAAEPFRPLLEVYRFDWPVICRRLNEDAYEEIDHVADALMDGMRQGQTAVGMAGCRRGEGSTTLLLSVARQLGERRLRVALVDAHLTRPDLARRLRLLPERGWEGVLAGRLSLATVAIRSVQDRLTVVPLRQPISRAEADAEVESDQPSIVETRMLGAIDTLADHYDLVLLDMGPLDDLTALGGVLAGRLDTMVLVHNPNVTSENQLAETQQHLARVQIAQAGIVRNFCRVRAIACG